jgi:putative sugar O-methyltransferase
MQNTVSFDDLASKIAKLRTFIDRNAEKSSKTPAGRTSEFWSEIFDARGNFPDLNQFAVFRREGNAAGVDHEALVSREAERAYHERMAHQFRRLVPTDYVASIPESTLGAPYVFEKEGISRSAAFWIQSGTSRRVLDFIEQFGPKRPLRVLEIGGGIGMCAYHLHVKTQIESYLIVDLKENLYLSSLYLSSLLPERGWELHEMDGDPLQGFKPQTLNFCFPGTIDRIGAKFDLVINSFSMHEMTLENVQTYIHWISTILADDGIFVSLNSHGKAGVRKPTDYSYGDFHIHHWGVFRQTPLAYFNTIAYEVVIGKRRASSPQYPQSAQDALGCLMQLGLESELEPFSNAMTAGTLDDNQREILDAYRRFFSADSDQAREAALVEAEKRDRSAIAPFVRAHFVLTNGDVESCSDLIRKSVDMGLGDFAKVKAGVLLTTIARQKGQTLPLLSLDGLDVMIAFPEAGEIAKNGDLFRLEEQAARLLGKPYRRSLLQRGIGKIERMTRGSAN